MPIVGTGKDMTEYPYTPKGVKAAKAAAKKKGQPIAFKDHLMKNFGKKRGK